jgi:hypothetical protein
MTVHVLVQVPGKPDVKLDVEPGASVEPLPSVRVSGTGPAGVVVEAAHARLTMDGRVLPGGERRLLRPGESVQVGEARILAAGTDPGTATQARRLLLAALRGDHPGSGSAIEVLQGPDAGHVLPLRDGVLGRGSAAALRLDDPSLSRSHARITVDGVRVLVEDLGSKNGTWMGGSRVSSLRELAPGEEVRAGRTVFALALAGFAFAPAPALAHGPLGVDASPGRRLARAARAASIAAAVAASVAAAAAALGL